MDNRNTIITFFTFMHIIFKQIITAYLRKTIHFRHGWMIIISFITILMSTTLLTIALAIMNGFEKATYTKLQGVNHDLSIKTFQLPLHTKAIQKVIENEFHEIKAYTFYTTQQGLIFSHNTEKIPHTVLLYAIDPTTYNNTSAIFSTLLSKNANFNDQLSQGKIIIGSSLAQEMKAQTFDTINCFIGSNNEMIDPHHISFETETLTIGGIFKTGIEEYDSSICFISLETLNSINSDYILNCIGIAIWNKANAPQIQNRLSNRLHLPVYQWQDLYPALISAMLLEKSVFYIIFLLMISMLGLASGSLFSLYIYQKKKDIHLLLLLGIPIKIINRLFTILGLLIVITASILGTLIGTLISYIITHYKLFTLPESYYIEFLTCDINITIGIIIIASITIITGIILLGMLQMIQYKKSIITYLK